MQQDRKLVNPFEFDFQNQGGFIGAVISFGLFRFFGYLGSVLPLVLILYGINRLLGKGLWTLSRRLIFVGLFLLALGTLFSLQSVAKGAFNREVVTFGGEVSYLSAGVVAGIFGGIGSYVVLVTLLLIFALVALPVEAGGFLLRILSSVKRIPLKSKKRPKIKREKRLKEEKPVKVPERGATDVARDSDVTVERDLPRRAEPVAVSLPGGYRFPPLDLLDAPPEDVGGADDAELEANTEMLRRTLATFGVEVDGEIEKFPGPVITRFEFKPAAGVKVSQIVNLSDDLALALKAKRVRIVAPIPGKAAIGVEVPNRKPQTVYLREILDSEEFQTSTGKLTIPLGKGINGQPYVTDLTQMPHLLIAGATGSGKSGCLNGIITGLFYRKPPRDLRFIFFDPKMLELSAYSGVPHLEKAVVTDYKQAEKVFAGVVVEMEERYRKLASRGSRNIEDYNGKATQQERLPYVVIIVDELADLMMGTSNRIEILITRLAQMARAVGIHLILATQRPSVDVITGLIKANFSSRIAFQVASKVDSRTILDCNGAEKLVGAGDMLFLMTGKAEPIRLHGAFVSTREIEQVASFVKSQEVEVKPLEHLEPERIEEHAQQEQEAEDLFRQAAELVVRHKQGSVSLLQRRLAVGYQRAARLIDQLEAAGIVGPYDGSRAREVLVDQSYLKEKGWA
ncbi:MAG: DNA translocase FtsK [Candidatus Zixiibacteriota bacterium]|nr:MAG: DNA translocase FtsK [candidate division Zixibacteria bacterium]